jgi:polysaccharide chain length determinant protein (PEP-CTERM system associated)
MKKLRLTNPLDYLAILVRRKWWVILPFLFLLLPLVFLIHQLPDVYISEAAILVEPREVPNDFVRNLVSTSPEQRLAAIQQEILSRQNLLRIINEFSEDLDNLEHLPIDRQIDAMRKQISLGPSAALHKRNDPGFSFRIAYQSQDPVLAQRVVNRLSTLFIEYDNRSREVQVYGTREFLESELQRIARQLDETDSRLRQIRDQYRHELPGQLQGNLINFDQLQNQKKANREALDRYNSLRLSLQRQITETPAVLSQTVPAARGGNFGQHTAFNEYSQKVSQLRELSTRYTEHHPDIRRLKAEIEQLRAALPPETVAQPDGVVTQPNPVHVNLTRQLEEVETEIQIRQREDRRLDGEIQKFELRIRNSPHAEQAIAPLERTRGELARQYQDLNSKLAQTLLSQSLEAQQKGDRFVVYEPANLPRSPSMPNRLFLVATVSFLSLGMALGTALAVDFTSQKLWTQSEVERLLGVPVLVEIPEILTEEESRREKRRSLRNNLLLVLGIIIFAGVTAAVSSNDTVRNTVVEKTTEFLGWY